MTISGMLCFHFVLVPEFRLVPLSSNGLSGIFEALIFQVWRPIGGNGFVFDFPTSQAVCQYFGYG